MFSKDNNIYVIGGKASDSRVFISTDGNELINYVCISGSIKLNRRSNASFSIMHRMW